jgi:hypothetical protein
MNHQTILLEDDNYDLNDDLPPEVDFSTLRRDKSRERRFRLQALLKIHDDEMRMGRLRDHADEAVKLLRVALADVEDEPRILPLAVQAVIDARGGLEGLDLSHDELLAILYGVNRQAIEPQPNELTI